MKIINRREFFRGTFILIVVSLILMVFGIGNTLADWVIEPTKAGFVPVKGGRIWYRMNGNEHFAKGKTPLIVIHGGPGFSHHYLLPLVDLADERPVILYDQLDSGHSDRPNSPVNWKVERFISEIDALREALGLDRVFVFGNSWGGTVAAEYAISQPAGLVAVVLSSPLISTERWIADNTEYRNQLPDDVKKVLDTHEAAGTIESKEYMDAVMVFYNRHLNRMDPWPAELNRSFEIFSPDLYVTMWGNTEFNATGTLKNYDASDRLSRIKVPVLYTCGEYDESTPKANKHFASLTPNAEVKVIPDASHTAFLENRKLYMTILREFFARFE
jgi:proline iminopeptidase